MSTQKMLRAITKEAKAMGLKVSVHTTAKSHPHLTFTHADGRSYHTTASSSPASYEGSAMALMRRVRKHFNG